MLMYCLKCKKGTESVDSKMLNSRTMLSSKCAVGVSKKSRFVKEKEAKSIIKYFRLKNAIK